MSKVDAIGFPLYSDLVVERLTLQVRFENLKPYGDRLTPQAWVIRRTRFGPDGPLSDFDEQVRQADSGNGSPSYVFGPLLCPKGGYFYCLTWGSLEPA